MLDFLARLHPLIVHLPIGITLLAIFTSWRAQKGLPDIFGRLVWAAAAGTGLLAAGTGWLLVRGGDYPYALTSSHQWLGGGTVAMTAILAALYYRCPLPRWNSLLAIPLLALLVLTAHFGVSLTHGDDYLTTAAPAAKDNTMYSMPATDIPSEPVRAPDAAAVHHLEALGMLVLPVAEGSHYLSINGINAPQFGNQEAALLLPLADQIVWLKLSGTSIGDSAMHAVGRLSKVSRLYIDHTRVGDAGIAALAAMSRLRFLNLSGLDISASSLESLKDLPDLETVHLYQCGLRPEAYTNLQKLFSKARLDTGGYHLPFLPGDTIRLQRPAY